MKKYSLFLRFSSIMAFLAILVFLFLFYNVGETLERHFYGVKPGVTLEGKDMSGFLRREVEDLVTKRGEEERVIPQNAYISRDNGEIVQEVIGREIDVLNTVNKVMEAEENLSIELIVVELDPEITAKLIESIDKVIGSYYTWMGSGFSRVTNIMVAGEAINNTLLHPGQVFSFNQATGPRTAERGYQYAPIIVHGSVVLGLGGGICQTSSTLYNAVLQSQLEVVERYPHSKPVGYVPKGKDATVSNYLDFKFRNNTDKFLLVKASSYGGKIEVEIWSS
ncbi:VanW family protein [Candidatus Contubernalis alkaliaceticus]|uniref:VanW family protein n=1 Tax=Candidatus Contubernalis alkaliaceticus TaxID=338645 RepID=UPI001F4BEA22|nr:VanW family protein [Candidatus Contubernalis alkalaceticus]UNC91846.1 VanW family protein [Candidatus Contubernalis alkalaceticus]